MTSNVPVRSDPFGESIETRFCFLDGDRQRNLARLLVRLFEGDGLFFITGVPGVGKSLLLRRLADQVKDFGGVALLDPYPRLVGKPGVGLGEILSACDGAFAESGGWDALRIARRLQDMADGRIAPVLLLDDADRIDANGLDALAELSALRDGQRRLLSVVLAGAPELPAGLAARGTREAASEDRQARVEPFSEADVARLVRHRLRIAGHGDANIFSADALEAIARHSAGLPRTIVRLCHRAILIAEVRSRKSIGGDIICDALEVETSGEARALTGSHVGDDARARMRRRSDREVRAGGPEPVSPLRPQPSPGIGTDADNEPELPSLRIVSSAMGDRPAAPVGASGARPQATPAASELNGRRRPERAWPERVSTERVLPERVLPERVLPERVLPERVWTEALQTAPDERDAKQEPTAAARPAAGARPLGTVGYASAGYIEPQWNRPSRRRSRKWLTVAGSSMAVLFAAGAAVMQFGSDWAADRKVAGEVPGLDVASGPSLWTQAGNEKAPSLADKVAVPAPVADVPRMSNVGAALATGDGSAPAGMVTAGDGGRSGAPDPVRGDAVPSSPGQAEAPRDQARDDLPTLDLQALRALLEAAPREASPPAGAASGRSGKAPAVTNDARTQAATAGPQSTSQRSPKAKLQAQSQMQPQPQMQAQPQAGEPRHGDAATVAVRTGEGPRKREVDVLLSEGDARLQEGDLETARSIYEQAYDRGSAQAAVRMAQTFDPRNRPAGTGAASSAEAILWYQDAARRGDRRARAELDALAGWLENASASGDGQARRVLELWREPPASSPEETP